jgi:hypothetical protein
MRATNVAATNSKRKKKLLSHLRLFLQKKPGSQLHLLLLLLNLLLLSPLQRHTLLTGSQKRRVAMTRSQKPPRKRFAPAGQSPCPALRTLLSPRSRMQGLTPQRKCRKIPHNSFFRFWG